VLIHTLARRSGRDIIGRRIATHVGSGRSGGYEADVRDPTTSCPSQNLSVILLNLEI